MAEEVQKPQTEANFPEYLIYDKEEGGKNLTIEFVNVETRVIWSQHYNGCLIEKIGKEGRTTERLDWARHLTSKNKGKALLHVYYYKAYDTADGTYVVLEFVQSEKFLYALRSPDHKDKLLLSLSAGGFDPRPENPEQIGTSDDPRVFLMKQTKHGGPEVEFIQSIGHVITLFRDPTRAAELCGTTGKDTAMEGQLFRLLFPEFVQEDLGDMHVVVPPKSKPGDEKPDKHHGESEKPPLCP